MRKGRTFRTNNARWAALCLALLLALAFGLSTADAAGGTRTLNLYYTHTKESGQFTFRKNGRYDQKVLAELNHFLRDWRRDEPTKMDPALFDLIWEVYQDVGATKPIYIVSAYRAPATNEMLRSKSSGVAKNSRHTMGMAMDFYIPGIPISKLREAAMKKQVGGVGYYPTSGSPFVHLDTGNVRAWPRMTKAQLTKLFPDGRTLHLPSGSNTPLSQEGYQIAKADWVKCHTIPCSSRTATTTFAVASADSDAPRAGNGKTLMDWLFGGNESDEGAVDEADTGATVTVVASAPSVPAAPPVPTSRPIEFYLGVPGPVANAPIPAQRPDAWFSQTEAETEEPDVIAVAAIETIDDAPQPAPMAPFITAYAPAAAPAPDAQRAVAMILARRAAETAPAPEASPEPVFNTTSLKAGVNGPEPDAGMLSDLINGTIAATATNARPLPMPADFEMRAPNLIAPDLDHVASLLVDPAFVSSDRYAIIFDHDQADFSPATELGGHAPKLTRQSDPAFGLGHSSFATATPLLVASR